jgi:hypothetical protein
MERGFGAVISSPGSMHAQFRARAAIYFIVVKIIGQNDSSADAFETHLEVVIIKLSFFLTRNYSELVVLNFMDADILSL